MIHSHPFPPFRRRLSSSRSRLKSGFLLELRLAGAEEGAEDGGYSYWLWTAADGEGGAVESGELGREIAGEDIASTRYAGRGGIGKFIFADLVFSASAW